MKVLSIRQPWAWLIMTGLKDVENRTWNTDFRGQFAIHASRKFDWDALIVLPEKRIPSWITQSMIAHFGLELAETPEKSKVTKNVTKVTKLWKGKVGEVYTRGKSPVFFYGTHIELFLI